MKKKNQKKHCVSFGALPEDMLCIEWLMNFFDRSSYTDAIRFSLKTLKKILSSKSVAELNLIVAEIKGSSK